MKTLRKLLGITAITAVIASIPLRGSTDEVTGVRTYETLLSKLTVRPRKEGKGADIRVDLLGGVIPAAFGKSDEEEDYADDELEDMVSEPIFEMKVERHVPAESKTQEGTETAEEAEEAEAPEAEEEPDEPEASATPKFDL